MLQSNSWFLVLQASFLARIARMFDMIHEAAHWRAGEGTNSLFRSHFWTTTAALVHSKYYFSYKLLLLYSTAFAASTEGSVTLHSGKPDVLWQTNKNINTWNWFSTLFPLLTHWLELSQSLLHGESKVTFQFKKTWEISPKPCCFSHVEGYQRAQNSVMLKFHKTIFHHIRCIFWRNSYTSPINTDKSSLSFQNCN